MIEKSKIILLAVVLVALIAVVGNDATQEAVAQAGGAKPELVLQNGHAAFSLAFSPDGKLLLSGGKSGVKLWDVSTGRLIKNIEGQNVVSFSPKGNVFASIGKGNTVIIWDAKTGRLNKTISVPTDQTLVSISFSADGTALAAATFKPSMTEKNGILIWDGCATWLVGFIKQIVGIPSNFRSSRIRCNI